MAPPNKYKRSVKKPSVVSRVRQAIDARLELKSMVTSQTTSLTTAGTVYYVSAIGQDDTHTGRTGTVIRPKKIEIRGVSYDTANPSFGRIIVFQDIQQQPGVSVAVTDVLDTASYIASYNFRNVEQSHRFRILFDKTLGNVPSGKNMTPFEAKIPMKGEIFYYDTSNLIASAGRGAIHMLLIGSGVSANVNVQVRTIFTDA